MLSPPGGLHPSPFPHDHIFCKLIDVHCVFSYCLAKAHVLSSQKVLHKSASQLLNNFVALF